MLSEQGWAIRDLLLKVRVTATSPSTSHAFNLEFLHISTYSRWSAYGENKIRNTTGRSHWWLWSAGCSHASLATLRKRVDFAADSDWVAVNRHTLHSMFTSLQRCRLSVDNIYNRLFSTPDMASKVEICCCILVLIHRAGTPYVNIECFNASRNLISALQISRATIISCCSVADMELYKSRACSFFSHNKALSVFLKEGQQQQ